MRKIISRFLGIVLLAGCVFVAKAAPIDNPQAVRDLLARVTNAADKFETVLDDALLTDGHDVFVITAKNGKPCIKGSSISAITTGINWYLNHYAHVNIAWNRLTTDLSATSLPVPTGEERHDASVDYRYYLNYCTASYSMSVWTWERWQKEIDWMALHGINMPLQIVGLDVVWYNLLTEDLGYSEAEAGKFVAGPCFQAWWAMNNMEGWGGPNPGWWYKRQAGLCKKILERERELGMEPVLPGYSGMVPTDIGSKGFAANSQGGWCGFTRPYILDPNSEGFSTISSKYYAQLSKLMGTSRYYSMDPFHEGANTDGIDVPNAYRKIAEAMTKVRSDARWVIQYWSWTTGQYHVLDNVDKGKLIVLDLYSDAHTHFDAYKGHDAVYCMIPNFGGRTGFFGRLSKMLEDFFVQKGKYNNVKGVGATPEAIEQVPVLYDALYELPWLNEAPDAAEWVKDYSTARYGEANADAAKAWEKLCTSALACPTGLQGPHEAVVCARPSLVVNSVSAWGGTGIFYDPQEVARAAGLLNASGLTGENYDYDVADLNRQALTDYSYYLLKGINEAHTNGDKEAYARRRDNFLALILDLDRLLNSYKSFMVGNWTTLARGIADEVEGTSETDRRWLELDNARTLISTWGPRTPAEFGLRDYSYREWGGMMKDYYYPRWKTFFDNLDAGTSQPAWFDMEWAWAHNASLSYSDVPVGNTAEIAAELFAKYFMMYEAEDGTPYYIYRALDLDYTKSIMASAYRGENFELSGFMVPADATATLSIDFNNDGAFGEGESGAVNIAVPATAVTGRVKARLCLSDGTSVAFTVALRDRITEPRTVSASSEDNTHGTVSIDGAADVTTITTDAEEVVINAIPATGYDFTHWADADGNTVSNDNPYTYYGKEAAEFVAHFIVNKWGAPEEVDPDYATIDSYGQYVATMKVSQNGGEPVEILSASECPDKLFQTTRIVNAAKGSAFTIDWKDPGGGLVYCRLSAYIDLNSDGDFDDEGEFLSVIGNKNTTSGNGAVSNGTLTVLLPYSVPIGITHVRFRFDSAWAGGWDSQTDAMPAKASTNRMVYDIPVNVTEYAQTACTVGVVTSDVKKGTVDANGQSNPYTYGVGEDVVLRAFPTDGYSVSHWTDAHGRRVPESWIDGEFLRFKAPESGVYTAYFKSNKQMTCGNWVLGCEDEGAGVAVTSVESGSGELDLSAANSIGKAVTAIAPEAFCGNTSLTRLVLPASFESFGNFVDTNIKGAGVEGAKITSPSTIAMATPWKLHMDVTKGDASFNQWGSSLLVAGDKPFLNSYNNSFQLYLFKSGELQINYSNSKNYKFTKTLGNNFSIDMTYDGNGKLGVTLTTAAGETESCVAEGMLNAISTFCTAIPAGVDINRITVSGSIPSVKAFAGCTALTAINVADGNKYLSSKDGILYDKSGDNLLAYPEGRLTTRAFFLKSKEAAPRILAAFPNANTNGTEIQMENRGVKAVDAAETNMAAGLFKLKTVEGGYKVEHLNSHRFFGSGSNVELPVSATQWHGTYNYEMSLVDNVPEIDLRLGEKHLAANNGDGGNAILTTAANSWQLIEAITLPVVVGANVPVAVCFPVAVVVPAADVATVSIVTSVGDGKVFAIPVAPGTVIAAGQGFLVSASEAGTVNLLVSPENGVVLNGNLLDGATAARTGFAVNTNFLLAENEFVLSAETSVSANTAYLPKSKCGEVGDVTILPLDDPTGINSIESATTVVSVYNADGRLIRSGVKRNRAFDNLAPGVYIINNKTYLKK